MIYVGIDIAKLNHFASAISSDGEVLIEPFKFTNDSDGFFTLLSKLNSFEKDNVIIGLESTAHYGNNLLMFLVPKGYKVCLINPIQTATLRKNNIRKTKTDSVDTYIIAKALMINDYRFVTLQDLGLMQLKNLGRFRQKIVKQRTRLKIQLTSYVDQVFPEIRMCDIDQKLRSFPGGLSFQVGCTILRYDEVGRHTRCGYDRTWREQRRNQRFHGPVRQCSGGWCAQETLPSGRLISTQNEIQLPAGSADLAAAGGL